MQHTIFHHSGQNQIKINLLKEEDNNLVMEIKDKIYGTIKITEPVLIELINAKPIQRLKKIHQAGATPLVIKNRSVTRYEHSVGVMILLKKLGATVEEQISGLLHDVPHTAFSHVIDFVFNDNNENHEFHEKFYEEIIMKSEIPSILKKYNFNVNRILNEKNFPLLERDLPDLCADRIDYTLRDGLDNKEDFEKINEFISNFIVKNNEIIMSNNEVAKKFAEEYLKLDEEKWSNPFEITLHQILADAIKIALKEKILTKDDLFTDDETVLEKLKKTPNLDIKNKLKMLNPNLKIIENENDFDIYSKTKLRYINPKFIKDNKILKVTDRYPEFLDKLKKHENKIKKGIFVKILLY